MANVNKTLEKITNIKRMIKTIEKGKKINQNVKDVMDNYKQIEANYRESKKELNGIIDRTHEYLTRVVDNAEKYATEMDKSKHNRFTNELRYVLTTVKNFWMAHGINFCHCLVALLFICVAFGYAFLQDNSNFLILMSALCFILASSVSSELDVDRVRKDVKLIKDEIDKVKEIANDIKDLTKK